MIIVCLRDGFDELGLLPAVALLRKEHFDVKTVALGTNIKAVSGAMGIVVLADLSFEDLMSQKDYPQCVEHIVCSPETLKEENPDFVTLLSQVQKEGGVVGPFTEVCAYTHHKETPVLSLCEEEYKFPPVDFLKEKTPDLSEGEREECQQIAQRLNDVFKSFGVDATVVRYDHGPRITRYEVALARGVRLSEITELFDDITFALSEYGVRMVAPIPGRSTIGYEIPNKRPSVVRLRELIETEEFHRSPSKTLVCIGKDIANEPVFCDIAKMPHMLIAGATGMGKSVCINAILISLLLRTRPNEVRLLLIDPKKVEFEAYADIPHLLIPVITEPNEAAGALVWVVEETERRYDLLEKSKVRNIDMYNAKVKDDPALGDTLPKIIIVIDELNDLMMQVRDPVENLILRIAQKARAAGIHLIIGTQRPTSDVLTGVIKANIPSRISFKVASQVDSLTILDSVGAEKLLDRGDMLFSAVGQEPMRAQGVFVSDAEVEAVTNFLRKENAGKRIYDPTVLEEIRSLTEQHCPKKSTPSVMASEYLSDKGFCDAVLVAIREGCASTSLLQRRLSIGFGKAAYYLDAMEELGIVSERCGQKPRDVLIDEECFSDMLEEYLDN